MEGQALRSAVKKVLEKEPGRELKFRYFKNENTQLYEEFKKELEAYEGDPDKWEKLCREAIIFEDLGAKKMYEELYHLSTRYADPGFAFKFESKSGMFTLPDRTMILVKLKILYRKLLYKIIPEIESSISFQSETSKFNTEMPLGTINWHATMLQCLQQGSKFPTKFAWSVSKTRFDTPENILACYCLLKLEYDANKIYHLGIEGNRIAPTEIQILFDIKRNVNRIRYHSNLNTVIEQSKKLLHMHINSQKIKSLESKTRQSIREGHVSQMAYQELLEWLEKYRGYNFPIGSEYLGDFPITTYTGIDFLYQYWVLFKMIDYFVQHQIRIIDKKKNATHGLEYIRMDYRGAVFTIHHEKTYDGWADVASKPDFVITDKNSRPLIVMDPKNYLNSELGQAIHKILGYLNNLQELGIRVGVIFCSKEWQGKDISEKTVMRNGVEFKIVVIKLNPNETTASEYQEAFEKVFSIIREQLDQTYQATT